MAKKHTKKAVYSEESRREIFADFGHRVKYGLMNAQEEARYMNNTIEKSNRSDYARIVDLRIPQGYHAQVRKSWEMYELDRMFRYLIDRQVDFAANGFEWELPYSKESKQSWWDFIEAIISGKNKEVLKIEKEQKFWNKWASTINKDVPNVVTGLDEVLKWIFKSFKLGAMAPLNWEWGTITVDKVDYEVPVRMVTQNCLSTVLVRTTNGFLDEQFWIKLSPQKNITESNKASNTWASMYENPTEGNSWHQIPILNSSAAGTKEQGFVLKYQWSPSDNTALNQGRSISVGQGLYPTPPYVSMYDTLMLRRALSASDLAILDGVIHYILDWSIGDNTLDKQGRLVNQPRVARRDSSGSVTEKSSIQLAKEAITNDNRGPVMQIFHPYYYKLDIKTPDVTSLISNEKYMHSTLEMFNNFGIFFSPTGNIGEFAAVNTQNFEEEMEGMRKYAKRFFESLCEEIVSRNEDELTIVPNMIFNVLNTKLEAFRASLINLMKIGKVSTKTLLQSHNLDDKVELMRIGKEISSGEKQLTDKNVPISYKQVAVGPDGEAIETAVSPAGQGGRPTGTKKPKGAV